MTKNVQEKPSNPKKMELIALSEQVRELVEAGMYSCVNEAVTDMFYCRDGHEEFYTFAQWLDYGKCVKKGEKAFVVWSSPRQGKRNKTAEANASPAESEDPLNKYEFFGLCYLFSNLQVDDLAPQALNNTP